MISRRFSGALGLIVLLPAWLGLAGEWHWMLDLMAHFRWQYLVASAVVAGLALWQRQPAVLALAAITLVLNGGLIGRLHWHGVAGAAAGDFGLRVLSVNVLTSNAAIGAVSDYLLESGADIVLLIEVDQKWLDGLHALKQRYPWQLADPRPDNFGIALLSRVPWTEAGLLEIGAAGLPSVQATFQHQGREFVFIGTHPVPPMGRGAAALRDEQLSMLAAHVAKLDKPAILAGDLNATPWSAGMRLLQRGGLGFRSLDPPWSPTWRTGSLFAIPIDHGLVTEPLIITRRVVGPDVGSDHRPVELGLGWEMGH